MSIDRVPKNDGQWHAADPAETRQAHTRFPRDLHQPSQRVVRRGWAGRVTRLDVATGKWEYDVCPHVHTKRTAARGCGERAAGRLNRQERRAGTHGVPSDVTDQ